MSDLSIWIVTVLLTLGTFLARSTFWIFGHRLTIPKRVNEALRFAPACALAAILIPDFLTYQQHIEISVANPKLIAALFSTGFFWMTRSMLGTILFGMVIFTLVRLLT